MSSVNPFKYPDDNFFRLSYDHALIQGRVWRFGVRKSIPQSGGVLDIALLTKADKLEFRKAVLSVTADGNANSITEVSYELRKNVIFDDLTGTDIPVYPLNFNVQYPAPADAPIYKQDPTISDTGILAAPPWYIDAPGRTIGNINEDALSILEPNSGYLVRVTNNDTVSAHVVDFHAAFSFPDIG